MANAPYKHADGSDCYTKNCKLGNARSLESANKAVYEEFAPKIQALHEEMERKLQQNSQSFAVSSPASSVSSAADTVNTVEPVTMSTNGVVSSNDPRVQNGEVLDKVDVGGQVYTRYVPGKNFPDSPYSMRIQANRTLSDEDKKRLAGLIGYNYRATVAGESLGYLESDSPYSFVIDSDTTKSQRDDLGMALEDFHNNMNEYVQQGTPLRKTNRSGPGTANTRLVSGFGKDFAVEIYYDDVFND